MRTTPRLIAMLAVSTLVTLVTPHVAVAQVPMISVPATVWSQSAVYATKISEIRAAVAPRRQLPVPRERGRTVVGRVSPLIDTRRTYTTADFIRVHFERINEGSGAPSLDVLLRKDDLYIVGWYNDQVAIDAQQGKGEKPVAENRRLPSTVWPEHIRVEPWPLATNYTRLCNSEMNDGSLKVGSHQLQAALKDVGRPTGSIYTEASLCQLAVMVAEAARFKTVSYTVQSKWITEATSSPLGVRQTLCIKNWKDMTQFLFWAPGKAGQFDADTLSLGSENDVHVYNRRNQLTTGDKVFKDAVAVFHGSGKAEAEAVLDR